MHGTRFDRLSRMFAARHGRRAALAGLGGVLSGLLTRAADPGEADAHPTVCRPRGSRCFPSRGLDCCQGTTCRQGRCRVQKRKRRPEKCQPTSNRCCRHRDCPENLICTNGHCQCPAGKKPCRKRCIAKNVCCGGCADDQLCRNGTCVAAQCGHGTPCRVFISESAFEGDLGGVSGADARCQEVADNSGFTSGGTYRAWLSTGAESPTTRFNHLASSGPFELVDGNVVASTWGDLISGADLTHAINLTQDSIPRPADAWTNTTVNGTPAGAPDCNGWTNAASGYGRIGQSTQVDVSWTDFADASCAIPIRLYCFEQR